MEDIFWMKDEARVEWEESSTDFESLFQKSHIPALNPALSFLDSQIQDYIYEKEQYPATNTGSQYLDPVWRQKHLNLNPELNDIEIFVSLN